MSSATAVGVMVGKPMSYQEYEEERSKAKMEFFEVMVGAVYRFAKRKQVLDMLQLDENGCPQCIQKEQDGDPHTCTLNRELVEGMCVEVNDYLLYTMDNLPLAFLVVQYYGILIDQSMSTHWLSYMPAWFKNFQLKKLHVISDLYDTMDRPCEGTGMIIGSSYHQFHAFTELNINGIMPRRWPAEEIREFTIDEFNVGGLSMAALLENLEAFYNTYHFLKRQP